MRQLCDACANAGAAGLAFKPPAAWAKFGSRAAAWAGDVWVCTNCKTHWYLVYHPKDMYYQEVARLPESLEPLVHISTHWRDAWACRSVESPLTEHFLSLFLEYAPLPWSEAASGIVADAAASSNERTFRYCKALFANYKAMLNSGTTVNEAALNWAACASLAPAVEATETKKVAWRALKEQAEQTIGRLQTAADTAARLAEAKARAVPTPRIFLPPIRPAYERIAGPEPLVSTVAYQPGAKAVMLSAWAHLAKRPFPTLGPALLTVVAIDACGPNLPSGGDQVAGFALLPMCLLYYAAAASVVAGRWGEPVWKLAIDRFGEIFNVWGAMLLAMPAWFAAAFLFDVIAPNTPATPASGRWLVFAALALPGLRFWPAVVIPFVYRGYRYYQAVDTTDVNTVWIGPGLRTAWRLSGQPGFFTRITLPFLAAVTVLIGFLELASWSWWARWVGYFVALPLFVQFADEAVDGWRILTGKEGIDR